MDIRRIFFWVLIAVIGFLLSSCAAPTRYTYDEIKQFPLVVQEQIMKGEIAIGMTPQQVRYAWGPPNIVRRLESVDGKERQEWIYSTLGIIEQKRLLFIDGRLTYIIPEPEKKTEKPEESEKK